MKKSIINSLAVLLLCNTMCFAALSVFAEIRGIKGEDSKGSRNDLIEIIGLDNKIASPRDAASGLPTGKRQHKPFTITKEIDKASPMLAESLANNQVLPEITFDFYRMVPAPGGTEIERNYYRIVLYDATIVSFNQKMDFTFDPVKADYPHTETIMFQYESIKIYDPESTQDEVIMQWEVNEGQPIRISDMNFDGVVNLADLSVLAKEWLE